MNDNTNEKPYVVENHDDGSTTITFKAGGDDGHPSPAETVALALAFAAGSMRREIDESEIEGDEGYAADVLHHLNFLRDVYGDILDAADFGIVLGAANLFHSGYEATRRYNQAKEDSSKDSSEDSSEE